MSRLTVFVLLALLCITPGSPVSAQDAPPVIDMHMHALPYTHQGPPPLAMCTPMNMPVWDQRQPYGETFMRLFKEPDCDPSRIHEYARDTYTGSRCAPYCGHRSAGDRGCVARRKTGNSEAANERANCWKWPKAAVRPLEY